MRRRPQFAGRAFHTANPLATARTQSRGVVDAVLAELAEHLGRVLGHAHLLRAAWGAAHEKQAEYLRVAVRGLRQKLEADPRTSRLILNEPVVGYRLALTP